MSFSNKLSPKLAKSSFNAFNSPYIKSGNDFYAQSTSYGFNVNGVKAQIQSKIRGNRAFIEERLTRDQFQMHSLLPNIMTRNETNVTQIRDTDSPSYNNHNKITLAVPSRTNLEDQSDHAKSLYIFNSIKNTSRSNLPIDHKRMKIRIN